MKIKAPTSPVARTRLEQIAGMKNLLIAPLGDGFKVFRLVLPTEMQPLAVVDVTPLVALSVDLAISGNGSKAIAYVLNDEHPATAIDSRLRAQGVAVNIATIPVEP